MRTDTAAEILIILGVLLIAVAALIWLGIAAALLVLGLAAIAAAVIIARGGIGR